MRSIPPGDSSIGQQLAKAEADSFFAPQTDFLAETQNSSIDPQKFVYRQHRTTPKHRVSIGFSPFQLKTGHSCCQLESVVRLVYRTTIGYLSTEKQVASSIAPQILVYRTTLDSSIAQHETRLSPTSTEKKRFKIKCLRRLSTGLTRARVLTPSLLTF